MKGRIKIIVRDRHFGYIRAENGKDIFFHRSNLEKGNFNTLEEGTPVEFQVVDGLKDPQAWSIKAIKSGIRER